LDAKPAHFDDLSGVAVGGFQELFSKVVQVQVFETEFPRRQSEELSGIGVIF
jgi:hypothetical protein